MALVSRLRSPLPIAVSVLLHGAVLAFLVRAPAVSASELPAVPEAWAGNTFDLDLVGLEPGKGAEAPPAAPPVATAPSEAPTPPTEAAPKDTAPSLPAAPTVRPVAKSSPPPKKDKEIDEMAAPAAAPAPPRAPAKRAPGKPAANVAEAGDAGDGKKKGGTFGAEGPSAARDIGNAFTRAIAPANQADAAWSKLPVGPAGTVDIAIAVDESGRVGEAEPVSKAPSPLLVSLAKRTILLLRGGVFHLKGGEATAGRQILRLRAEVSDVDAAAVQGGTIDLAFSYQRGQGKAAFTRPGGRHVEVSVTLLRVEAQPAL